MHILFLTDNFPPEGNAPATRTFEHAREWVGAGHRVTVITCAPNFPEGVVYPGYRNAWYSKEDRSGIEVRRVKTYITANEGFFRRTLDYLSFMFASVVAGLFVPKPDVIVATSPQFFCACGGWVLSVLRWRPFVFELRDIWPASIKAVGASGSSWLIRVLERIELFLYRRAALIVSVTHSFKDELVERSVPADKIVVVLNGVDLEQYQPVDPNNESRESLQLHNKFVAAYIGTIGMAHAVDTLIEAAELLREHDDIAVLIVGGGAEATNIKTMADERNLPNLLVMDRQSKDKMPAIWGLTDLSIVHLRDTPLFSKVIPSKIFESFAMGLPVLIAVPEGEATHLVAEQQAGMVCPPQDPEALARCIVSLKEDAGRYRELREHCTQAARKFDRKRLALEMLNELKSVASRG